MVRLGKTNSIALILLVLILVATGALMVLQPSRPKVGLARQDCPFPIPAGEKVECGTLRVPERWNDAKSPSIDVFFAVLRNTARVGGERMPDPILVLNGGPGQAGSDLIAAAWEGMADLRRTRNIIFVDQRGTGRSSPALFCPDMDPVAFWHGSLTPNDAETCLKPFRAAGVDLAAFNTQESARDLKALRQALGAPAWNLLGTSYGSVLGLELVRQDRMGVRSVVLNSPVTPSASWLAPERLEGIRAVFRQVFADCAAQPACAAAYPGLDRVFLDLAQRMDGQPLPVRYTDPRTGKTVETRLSFANALTALTVLAGTGDGAAHVPGLLWHLHQVSLGVVAPGNDTLAWLYMPFAKVSEQLAYGLNAAIGCRESRPAIDPAAARAAGRALMPYVLPEVIETDYDVFCPALNLSPASAEARSPVTSDVPALLLTGAYDTLAVTALADTVAGTLPASQILRFRGLGHDLFTASACARTAVARFLDNPQDKLDPACVGETTAPVFITPKRS